MNVIVTIEGKEAIPVRAIPLLTDWQILSPDVCARIFSGDDTLEYFEGVSAHRLNPDGGHQVIEQREWANWIARKLRACSERIKAAQASHESGYQQWRQESLALLPPGAFVWREAFEAAHAREYGPNSMRARFNRDTFNPTACELNYDPQHGPCENWRELVMDGFELLTPTQRKAATPEPVVKRGTPKALTEEQEAEIVRLYQCGRGMSVNKLARQFYVSRRTIDEALGAAGVKQITPRKGRSVAVKSAREAA
ncbi:MAG: hypothetical protein EON54_08915 [Alcaligenaceae bacterium]|nr:MAG: hypothetical protein EON54_08915 [Alcaligenaceae bacterium]